MVDGISSFRNDGTRFRRRVSSFLKGVSERETASVRGAGNAENKSDGRAVVGEGLGTL